MRLFPIITVCITALTGCTLTEPIQIDLGTECGSSIARIELSSGKSCYKIDSDSDADPCPDCSTEDKNSCNSFLKSGVFEYNRCPHELSCVIDTQTDDLICKHTGFADACDSSMGFLCSGINPANAQNTSKCVSNCSKCEAWEACYTVVATETEAITNAQCDIGQKKCDDKELMLCAGGDWTHYKTCTLGCDEVEAKCIAPCEENKLRCEGNTVQICMNELWKDGATCDNGCENGACIQIDDSPKCTESTTRCSETDSNIVQICKNNTWLNYDECPNGCEEGECKALELGQPCSEKDYQQKCFNKGANALICRNQAITQIRCANRDCNETESGTVNCSENCTAQTPYECAPACSPDLSAGYYYSDGKTITISCPNHDCAVVDEYVSCNNGAYCNAQTPSKSSCVPHCSDDKKTGYYMSNAGLLHTLSCPNADCNKVGSYLYCGKQEECDRNTYVPTCSETKSNQGKYCSSDGIVKTWTCYPGTCAIKTDGTCEGSAKCVRGTYNTVDYPMGFVDCVDNPDVPNPDACDINSSPMKCENNSIYACGNKGYYKYNTCPTGYQCVVKDNDFADCFPDAAMQPCDESSPAICDKENLYVCSSKTKTYYQANTCQSPYSCQVNGRGYGECIPQALIGQCKPNADHAYCDGQNMYVCMKDDTYKDSIPLYTHLKTCSKAEPCHVTENGHALCLPKEIAETCDTGKEVCYENHGLKCMNGEIQDTKTCADGYRCVVGESNYAYCVPQEIAHKCDSKTSPAYCYNDSLYICGQDGNYFFSSSCNNCYVDSNGYGQCVSKTFPKSCKAGDPAFCEGKKLFVCGAKDNKYYYKETCSNKCTVGTDGFGKCT